MSVAGLDERAAALRAVGFTADAVQYPRGELALRMFAAFNGVTTDKLPEGFRYFPNEATQNAWQRVADAAEAFFAERQP